MRTATEIVFWASATLIAWTQVGYALAVAALARVVAPAPAVTSTSRARPNNPPHPQATSGASIAHMRDEGDEERKTDSIVRVEALPSVSLIVAAHDEAAVIGAKVENALALDYPRELLELIVACDGCTDATAQRARDAGADLVLELPRGGKIAAQDTAVERARGELVAFSDANALWEPDALRELVSAFSDPRVGYACGRVRFVQGPHLP
ncbi:MAG TPA: glycosyltransferase, partial [Solirubrobacteraceae bacterium]|nr:glycosyltransferase [Solirubrobacteraceae bacterium]